MKVMSTGGKLPTRNNPNDAGLDLYAAKPVWLRRNEPAVIPTGIKIALPENTFGLIKPKSRHSFLIGAGVVDEGYRGELLVRVIPFENQYIKKDEAIAQLIVVPILYPKVEKSRALEVTPRGESAGIKRAK
jgi:dUTP pyrophosphatase